VTKQFQVLETFDPNRDYGVSIQPRFHECFKHFERGQIITQSEFTEKHLTESEKSRSNWLWIVNHGFRLGTEIGILKEVLKNPISFKEFYQLESVQYYASQLKGSRYKNLHPKRKIHSTKEQYLYRLWEFNNWLHGKTFEFSKVRYVDTSTFKKEKKKVTINTVEDFLKLYQDSFYSESEYIKIIKQFLMDSDNGNVSSNYIKNKKQAIVGYFEKNDTPLTFHFDPSVMYNSEEPNQDTKLSLEDLLKMLTSGRTSILDKAVVLCKFHRGLDNITFVDRFNFEAWEQIVKWFGSDIHMSWDLEKCPVPIILTRIKTGYKHRGFLDRDAISSLQNYLNKRFDQTGTAMKVGEPIFINSIKQPISVEWLMRLVPRLAQNAGIQNKFKVNKIMKNEKTSHELRDLLKSTLISCDVVQYVCEMAIGHKVKDSYEKQDKLYPNKSRAEFMKASKKINIFTNIANHMEGDEEKLILQNQIQDMKRQSDQDKTKYDIELAEIKSVLSRLVENENLKKKLIPTNYNTQL